MKLTDKQLECVMHLANGKDMKEISSTIFVSESQVKKTLRSARTKCEAKNNAHLVAIVIAKGWLVWHEDDNEHSIENEKGPPQSYSPFPKTYLSALENEIS
jgi:DNA-binding CsgD family transcriptional regulator